jgi:hypothetical protein
MPSQKRWVLEGTWRGYSSSMDRVVHREVCSQKKAEWANKTFNILYTDGTTLELHARLAKPRERVEEKKGYTSLINDCYYQGVRSVAELTDIRDKHRAERAQPQPAAV